MQGVIETCRPDVIATQEGRRPQIQDLSSLIPGFELVDAHRDWIEHRMYPCLFLRSGRFTVLDSGDVWLSESPGVPESQLDDSNYPRLVSWVHLRDDVDSGELVVANVHLDNAGPDVRRRQTSIAADELSRISSEVPLVLCGDFNDSPDSEVAGMLAAKLPELYDPWLLSDRREQSTFRGFSRRTGTAESPDFIAPRIDWILLDRRLSFECIRRVEDEPGGMPPTDHYPVVCTGIRSDSAVMAALSRAEPVIWHNPSTATGPDASSGGEHTFGSWEINAVSLNSAESRMKRYESLLPEIFPELQELSIGAESDTSGRWLRSPLRELPGASEGTKRVFGKCDNELPVAGSIKARGGFYEVLYHAERLLGDRFRRDWFRPEAGSWRGELAKREIVVASTGNLGLSIGLLGRALGFSVTVVMSREARQWKKDLLRERGAVVEESGGDYSSAVLHARTMCDATSADSDSDARDAARYFVDDERSPHLFMGYACAAGELLTQLEQLGLEHNRVRVYLPCGVGGAPGGIAWALRQLAGTRVDSVLCEPVEAPCFLLALLDRRGARQTNRAPGPCPHVQTIGRSARSEADGLAVGAASPLAVDCTESIIAGVVTLPDARVIADTLELRRTYGIMVEPSSAAAYSGLKTLECETDVHILWFTGGGLLPESEFERLNL